MGRPKWHPSPENLHAEAEACGSSGSLRLSGGVFGSQIHISAMCPALSPDLGLKMGPFRRSSCKGKKHGKRPRLGPGKSDPAGMERIAADYIYIYIHNIYIYIYIFVCTYVHTICIYIYNIIYTIIYIYIYTYGFPKAINVGANIRWVPLMTTKLPAYLAPEPLEQHCLWLKS